MTTKRKRSVGERIRDGLLEAIAFERGEVRAQVDRVLVTARHAEAKNAPAFERRRIIDLRRKTMRLSQTMFAAALNVSPETVRAWEQGKSSPGGPALRLLEIAEMAPGLILQNVSAKPVRSVVREVQVKSRGRRLYGKTSPGRANKTRRV